MIAATVIVLLLFAACALLTLGRSGVRLLCALCGGGLALGVLLPWAALHGLPPLVVAFPAGLVALSGLFIIGGATRKSLAAFLGASAGMAVAAVLPLAVSALLGFSGLDTHFGPRPHLEVMLWYSVEFARVDFPQLLLAAILLAALGGLMDVAMAIASAVETATARLAEHATPRRTLYGIGYRVGVRILGPMLACMALVFVGGDLAMHVARAAQRPDWAERVTQTNFESVAVEFMELAATGVGLLACIPVTAALAAWLLSAWPRRGAASAGEADG